jgi:hypothetical protein
MPTFKLLSYSWDSTAENDRVSWYRWQHHWKDQGCLYSPIQHLTQLLVFKSYSCTLDFDGGVVNIALKEAKPKGMMWLMWCDNDNNDFCGQLEAAETWRSFSIGFSDYSRAIAHDGHKKRSTKPSPRNRQLCIMLVPGSGVSALSTACFCSNCYTRKVARWGWALFRCPLQ